MPKQPLRRPRSRFFPARPAAAVGIGWLAVGVAVVTSAIVVTNVRPAYLRLGLDRQQGMSWMSLYAITAGVSGGLALALLHWPWKVKVLVAVTLVLQFLFVTWVAGHDGACVFGCGPFIA
jgi:hypothetical protein